MNAPISEKLEIDRCPHCSVAQPNLGKLSGPFQTSPHSDKSNVRYWSMFKCETCGGVILTVSNWDPHNSIYEMWPETQTVPDVIPARARQFLTQAINSIHAPSGAVMLAASAIDAMLKDRNYKEDSLFTRIDKAASDHLITAEMAAWAHETRLDANDQRHADEDQALPDEADAQKVIEFASALAQFLYVLPARVKRGRIKPE